jgi:hypothetical protein
LKEARRLSLSYELTRVLANYLKDRFIVLDNPIVKKIFASVPQDSVVGPLLWNLVYDGLLTRFDNHVNLRAIAFADDLVVMVGLKIKESVEDIVNLHMKTILNWCEISSLQIAKEEREIVLLTT